MKRERVLTVLGDSGDERRSLQSDLKANELHRCYESMCLTRHLDERCLRLQRAGRIGFYVPSTGQEAVSVGSALALAESDWLFPSYRDPGMYLSRGGTLDQFLAQLLGSGEDLVKGRQMPCHHSLPDGRFVSISSPVGTQITQAVGVGMAMRMRGAASIVLVSFGDGATSGGDFHAGMNFAGVFEAPVVFLCQNNGWALSMPSRRQTAAATLAGKAFAYGFAGVRVDGNDCLAVYEATREARQKALSGGGPTLIEAVADRRGPHSSADDPKKYQTASEDPECSGESDPIERFRLYLEQRGLWNSTSEEELEKRCVRRVNEAIEATEHTEAPRPESLFLDVYMGTNWMLEEQRRQLQTELAEADRWTQDDKFPR